METTKRRTHYKDYYDRFATVELDSSRGSFTPEAPGDAFDVKAILEVFGPAASLAKALGVNLSTVSLWNRRGVPLELAFAVEHHSGGRLRVTEAAIRQRFSPYRATKHQ